MNALTITVFVGLCGIGLILGIPTVIEYYRKRKNRKWFNSVQIGDVYIEDNREYNPFLNRWGSKITITDKKIGDNGLMYVKYINERTSYKEISSFEFLIETRHFVPYTGQDKEQSKQ